MRTVSRMCCAGRYHNRSCLMARAGFRGPNDVEKCWCRTWGGSVGRFGNGAASRPLAWSGLEQVRNKRNGAASSSMGVAVADIMTSPAWGPAFCCRSLNYCGCPVIAFFCGGGYVKWTGCSLLFGGNAIIEKLLNTETLGTFPVLSRTQSSRQPGHLVTVEGGRSPIPPQSASSPPA